MRLIWILLALLLSIWLMISKADSGTAALTEDWSGDIFSRWESAPGSCDSYTATGGILTLICNSGGLRTRQLYDNNKPLTIWGTMRVQPYAGPGYWGGFILVAKDDWEGCNYINMALNWWKDEFSVNKDQLTILHNMGVCNPGLVNSKHTAGEWHSFKIEYKQQRFLWWTRWITRYYFDGEQVYQGNGKLSIPFQVGIECVAVAPGSPNAGERAECEFGPLTITG